MLDLLAHKDSRVFQVPRDPLVNLVRRELVEPQESLVQLDALGLLVNVVILEREDLLESKDLKVKHLICNVCVCVLTFFNFRDGISSKCFKLGQNLEWCFIMMVYIGFSSRIKIGPPISPETP